MVAGQGGDEDVEQPGLVGGHVQAQHDGEAHRGPHPGQLSQPPLIKRASLCKRDQPNTQGESKGKSEEEEASKPGCDQGLLGAGWSLFLLDEF